MTWRARAFADRLGRNLGPGGDLLAIESAARPGGRLARATAGLRHAGRSAAGGSRQEWRAGEAAGAGLRILWAKLVRIS